MKKGDLKERNFKMKLKNSLKFKKKVILILSLHPLQLREVTCIELRKIKMSFIFTRQSGSYKQFPNNKKTKQFFNPKPVEKVKDVKPVNVNKHIYQNTPLSQSQSLSLESIIQQQRNNLRCVIPPPPPEE